MKALVNPATSEVFLADGNILVGIDGETFLVDYEKLRLWKELPFLFEPATYEDWQENWNEQLDWDAMTDYFQCGGDWFAEVRVTLALETITIGCSIPDVALLYEYDEVESFEIRRVYINVQPGYVGIEHFRKIVA